MIKSIVISVVVACVSFYAGTKYGEVRATGKLLDSTLSKVDKGIDILKGVIEK